MELVTADDTIAKNGFPLTDYPPCYTELFDDLGHLTSLQPSSPVKELLQKRLSTVSEETIPSFV